MQKIKEGDVHLNDFHTNFVSGMWNLDRAMRFNYGAVVVRQRIATRLKWAIWIATVSLVATMTVALLAFTELDSGLPDSINIGAAGLLVALIWATSYNVLDMLHVVGTSGDDDIDKAADEHIKQVTQGRSSLSVLRERFHAERAKQKRIGGQGADASVSTAENSPASKDETSRSKP